ncbi:MAG: hypothetical protein ACREJC_11475, partial [Tepidisphaeraceae bacterium]
WYTDLQTALSTTILTGGRVLRKRRKRFYDAELAVKEMAFVTSTTLFRPCVLTVILSAAKDLGSLRMLEIPRLLRSRDSSLRSE